MKTCGKCKIEKPVGEFSKHKLHGDGLSSECKVCVFEYNKVYYENNRDTILEQKKVYQDNNKEKISETQKVYHKNNRDTILARQKVYYENNIDKAVEHNKVYYEDNKEDISEKAKVYRDNNKERIAEAKKEYSQRDEVIKRRTMRFANDPAYRTKELVRRMVRRAFKSIGLKKNMRTLEFMNCSNQDLIDHQNLFLGKPCEDCHTTI